MTEFWKNENLTYEDIMNRFFAKRTVDTDFDFSKKYVEWDWNNEPFHDEMEEFREIFKEEVANNYNLYGYDKKEVLESCLIKTIYSSMDSFETPKDIQDNIKEYIDESISELHWDDDDDDW